MFGLCLGHYFVACFLGNVWQRYVKSRYVTKTSMEVITVPHLPEKKSVTCSSYWYLLVVRSLLSRART
jgi:hypothetical protein